MPKLSKFKQQKLSSIFGELKSNPPKVLAKTARKKGATVADKQRIAIALSKAGLGRGK